MDKQMGITCKLLELLNIGIHYKFAQSDSALSHYTRVIHLPVKQMRSTGLEHYIAANFYTTLIHILINIPSLYLMIQFYDLSFLYPC